MKGNGLKKIAMAMCAWALVSSAADAQSTSSNAVQSSLRSSSGYSIGSGSELSAATSADAPSLRSVTVDGALTSGEEFSGSFAVTRFAVRDGQLVAFGRLVPTSSELSASSDGSVTGGLALSSPIEPVGGYGSDPELGAGSRISFATVPLGSGSELAAGSSSSVGIPSGGLGWRSASSEPFDGSSLGNWTGIGTGYGESGVESRSTMSSDLDGPVSMNLARPFDEQSYMEDITVTSDPSLELGASFEADLGVGSDFEAELYPLEDDELMSELEPIPSVTLDARTTSAPFVQLGGSANLYTGREAERAAIVVSPDYLAIPVSVLSASCDQVTLSFGPASTSDFRTDANTVTITSLSGSDRERLGGTLCDVAESSSMAPLGSRNASLLKHLNRLVSHTR